MLFEINLCLCGIELEFHLYNYMYNIHIYINPQTRCWETAVSQPKPLPPQILTQPALTPRTAKKVRRPARAQKPDRQNIS